jgi:hypothetical protein
MFIANLAILNDDVNRGSFDYHHEKQIAAFAKLTDKANSNQITVTERAELMNVTNAINDLKKAREKAQERREKAEHALRTLHCDNITMASSP